MKRLFLLLLCSVFISGSALLHAEEVLRIGTYNTYNNPDTVEEDALLTTIITAMGRQVVNGNSQRLDILALVETDRASVERVAAIFNTTYGLESYQQLASGADEGGDRTGVVYDSQRLELLDIGELSRDFTHHVLRLHFRPLGSAAWQEHDFYLYVIHLKSGNSLRSMQIRADEAALIREDAERLQAAHILYVGDFNFTSAFEAGFVELSAGGGAEAFDPVDAIGEWKDNIHYADLHTQNPANKLNDRFDLQLVTAGLLNGDGLDYVRGSYRVLGNDGSHRFGQGILTGDAASDEVLEALVRFSDHLPVQADYRLETSEGVDNTDGVSSVDEGGSGSMDIVWISLLFGWGVWRGNRALPRGNA